MQLKNTKLLKTIFLKIKNPRPQVSQGPCLKQIMPMITSQDCYLNAQQQVLKREVGSTREKERLKAQSRRKYSIYSGLRTAVAKIA